MKNGFTLAELMGVIVLLGILAIIVATSVDKDITSSRYEMCKTQEKNIIEAAKMMTTDDASRLPVAAGEENGTEITIGELKAGGYLDEEFENPMTKNAYSDNVEVKITITATELPDGQTIVNKDYKYTVNYENSTNDECRK